MGRSELKRYPRQHPPHRPHGDTNEGQVPGLRPDHALRRQRYATQNQQRGRPTMKFNEEDLQSNIMDLIQEREKYRMQALIFREVLEKILGCKDENINSVVFEALKAGDDV